MRVNLKENKKNKIIISACTITKNEEKNIERSIKSYKRYVDEIIVVDTGSTDKTVEIAKKLGARVINFKWCNDFAKAKNVAIDDAMGDWIVFLDADESFGGDTAKNIRQSIVYANEKNMNLIACMMDNLNQDQDDSLIASNRTIRIFKKGARFHFPVHEEIYFPNDTMKVVTLSKQLMYINHTGYSKSIINSKGERNLKLILEAMDKEDKPQRKNNYYFYLSDAYFSMSDYENAAKYGELFLNGIKKYHFPFQDVHRRIHSNIYKSKVVLGEDPESMRGLVDDYTKDFEDYIDADFTNASNDYNCECFDESEKYLKKVLDNYDTQIITVDTGLSGHKDTIYNLLGNIKEAQFLQSDAMDYYFKAFKENSTNYNSIFNLLRIIKGYPKDKLNSFCLALYENKPNSVKIQVLAGLISNYMFEQMLTCYASLKSTTEDKALDSEITAYLLITDGKYAEASKLFDMSRSLNGSGDVTRNSLLCAILSEDEKLIDQMKQYASPAVRFSFGLENKDSFSFNELQEIAELFVQLSRMGKQDVALKYLPCVCEKLNDKELFKLTRLFIRQFCFDLALFSCKQASLCSESFYYQGYCLYRNLQFNEAIDMINLSKSKGCKRSSIENLITYCKDQKQKKQDCSDKIDKSTIKKEIEDDISNENYINAFDKLRVLIEKFDTDAEVYTMKAVLMFYCGLYKDAAISVECGLLKDSKSKDLLLNAGYIYDKLGNSELSLKMFNEALKYSGDEATKTTIRSIISTMKQAVN